MKLPRTFQTEILARFMSEKALVDLYQEYKDNRKHAYRSVREVTKQDLNILADWKAQKLMPNELMRKYKCSRNQLNTALRIAALSKV